MLKSKSNGGIVSQDNNPPMLAGYFLMVSRNPVDFKSKKLPKLRLETEQEKLFAKEAIGKKYGMAFDKR